MIEGDFIKELLVFKQILDYKKSGYAKSETANILCISRATVNKYWNLDSKKEIEDLFHKNCKTALLSKYEETVRRLIYEKPTISANEICQMFFIRFNERYSERTMSRFLRYVRQKYGLQKERFR